MAESKMKTFLSVRAARKEVQQLMKQWGSVRLAEDDRRNGLIESTKEMFRRAPSESLLSEEDHESLHEQVAKTTSFLRESTELGKQNTQDYERCAEELIRSKSMSTGEALSVLVKLQGEVAHVLNVEIPLRSSVLDDFDRETSNLNDLLGRLTASYR